MNQDSYKIILSLSHYRIAFEYWLRDSGGQSLVGMPAGDWPAPLAFYCSPTGVIIGNDAARAARSGVVNAFDNYFSQVSSGATYTIGNQEKNLVYLLLDASEQIFRDFYKSVLLGRKGSLEDNRVSMPLTIVCESDIEPNEVANITGLFRDSGYSRVRVVSYDTYIDQYIREHLARTYSFDHVLVAWSEGEDLALTLFDHNDATPPMMTVLKGLGKDPRMEYVKNLVWEDVRGQNPWLQRQYEEIALEKVAHDFLASKDPLVNDKIVLSDGQKYRYSLNRAQIDYLPGDSDSQIRRGVERFLEQNGIIERSNVLLLLRGITPGNAYFERILSTGFGKVIRSDHKLRDKTMRLILEDNNDHDKQKYAVRSESGSSHLKTENSSFATGSAFGTANSFGNTSSSGFGTSSSGGFGTMPAASFGINESGGFGTTSGGFGENTFASAFGSSDAPAPSEKVKSRGNPKQQPGISAPEKEKTERKTQQKKEEENKADEKKADPITINIPPERKTPRSQKSATPANEGKLQHSSNEDVSKEIAKKGEKHSGKETWGFDSIRSGFKSTFSDPLIKEMKEMMRDVKESFTTDLFGDDNESEKKQRISSESRTPGKRTTSATDSNSSKITRSSTPPPIPSTTSGTRRRGVTERPVKPPTFSGTTQSSASSATPGRPTHKNATPNRTTPPLPTDQGKELIKAGKLKEAREWYREKGNNRMANLLRDILRNATSIAQRKKGLDDCKAKKNKEQTERYIKEISQYIDLCTKAGVDCKDAQLLLIEYKKIKF